MTDDLTAREQLHREAMWGLLQAGVDDASSAADRLIDAYTHELAEKIRTEGQHATGGAWDGYMSAADLIDPEVTT